MRGECVPPRDKIFMMLKEEQLRKLTSQWRADCVRHREEAQRLERSDASRHATSISMLDTEANALERCAHQVEQAMAAWETAALESTSTDSI